MKNLKFKISGRIYERKNGDGCLDCDLNLDGRCRLMTNDALNFPACVTNISSDYSFKEVNNEKDK